MSTINKLIIIIIIIIIIYYGKPKVNPKKYISILCLELLEATLFVKMAKFLRKELNIDRLQETFLFDSKVVLEYTRNTIKKLKIFISKSN